MELDFEVLFCGEVRHLLRSVFERTNFSYIDGEGWTGVSGRAWIESHCSRHCIDDNNVCDSAIYRCPLDDLIKAIP